MKNVRILIKTYLAVSFSQTLWSPNLEDSQSSQESDEDKKKEKDQKEVEIEKKDFKLPPIPENLEVNTDVKRPIYSQESQTSLLKSKKTIRKIEDEINKNLSSQLTDPQSNVAWGGDYSQLTGGSSQDLYFVSQFEKLMTIRKEESEKPNDPVYTDSKDEETEANSLKVHGVFCKFLSNSFKL